jgi:hypothetical protein
MQWNLAETLLSPNFGRIGASFCRSTASLRCLIAGPVAVDRAMTSCFRNDLSAVDLSHIAMASRRKRRIGQYWLPWYRAWFASFPGALRDGSNAHLKRGMSWVCFSLNSGHRADAGKSLYFPSSAFPLPIHRRTSCSGKQRCLRFSGRRRRQSSDRGEHSDITVVPIAAEGARPEWCGGHRDVREWRRV